MMARLPVHAAGGLIRRLFHSSSNSEAVKCITSSSDKAPSCITCVLWPLQAAPYLGHAAIGWAGTPSHAYHRGGSRSPDEEEQGSSEAYTTSHSTDHTGSPGSKQRSSSNADRSRQQERPTQQLQDLRRALEDLQPDSYSDRHEAQQLPEHVARIAMRDPLGVLISSLGVPLGISLKVNRSEVLQQHAENSRRAALDEFGLSRLSSYDTDLSLGTDGSEADASSSEGMSAAGYSQEDSSTSVPRTDMQRLRQELLLRTRRMARRHRQQAASSSSSRQDEQQEAAAAAAEGEADAGDSAAAGSLSDAAGLHQKLDSIRAMIRACSDRWGTTQQSPAEIAQQIADSNRAAAGGGGGGGAGDGSGGEEGSDVEDDEPLTLNPGEERYADASTVGAELKEMDEIFEVLAKVPWLDDEDVEERELRGLAAVGLLGTLEEVGWTIREKLLALWGGERDEEVLTAGLGPREASAMASILYHTQQLEAEYGKPPAASVEAALAAANLGGGDGQEEGHN